MTRSVTPSAAPAVLTAPNPPWPLLALLLAPHKRCASTRDPACAHTPLLTHLVPGLEVHLVLLPVWHLVALHVHAGAGAEDVLLNVAHSLQHHLALGSLAPVDVIHDCGQGREGGTEGQRRWGCRA